ncbi:MAG: VWA domain-containing protein [Terracidiphilus sp.]|jgi:VWFA-related protein
MSRVFFCWLIAAWLTAPAVASGQSAPSEPATTLRNNANLVVLDVVVTDSQKNPVHKLASTDFTVLENGHEQTIKAFEEHAASESAAPSIALKLDPGVFTNYSAAPAHGALNILLLDTMNTPMQDQPFVRDEMLRYLKEPHPGTRMAIFGLGYRLRLIEGFTSDPEILRAALTGKKAAPNGSPLLNDPVAGDAPGADDPLMDSAAIALGNAPNGAMMLANLQQFEAESQSFQLQLRMRFTLDALNQLGRYLSSLPGRKNLIWFSGSFPISVLPDGDLQDPFGVMASMENEFRETTDLLSRSQVAAYPIDARGLTTSPMMNASNSGRKYANNPSAFSNDNTKFSQQTADEHATMKQMADATGGEAFINTNDLTKAVANAIAAGSNYYTLTYTPPNGDWKGEYRKIQVKVARQGLTLAYRRGYYADDPRAPVHHGEMVVSSGSGPAPYSAMRTAMLRGGPDPTEVLFKAGVRPSSADTEATVAPGNQASQKAQGPFRRYTVSFAIVPNGIDCAATPDGVHHCHLESMIFVYDADGVLLNSQSKGFKADIPADRAAALLAGGLHFKQEISVPVKGESYLRIGIHDVTTDRVGAVELPVAAVSKLPPAAAK